MDKKYLKTAVILVLVSFLTVTAVLGLVLLSVRGPSCMIEPVKPTACSSDQAAGLSSALIKYSSTFAFDGIKDSIKQIKVETTDNGQTWKLVYVFRTTHPGHGDRSGLVLAQVITEHSVQITVGKCKILSAVCDKSWDMLKDRPLAQS
jgi:hypothetical protein